MEHVITGLWLTQAWTNLYQLLAPVIASHPLESAGAGAALTWFLRRYIKHILLTFLIPMVIGLTLYILWKLRVPLIGATALLYAAGVQATGSANPLTWSNCNLVRSVARCHQTERELHVPTVLAVAMTAWAERPTN